MYRYKQKNTEKTFYSSSRYSYFGLVFANTG